MVTDQDVRPDVRLPPASPPEALQVLSVALRWRIVVLLATEELCVCHLVEELGVSQPLVSHHLRTLRGAGLVESRRERYWTYYRLRHDAVAALVEILGALASAPVAGPARRSCP